MNLQEKLIISRKQKGFTQDQLSKELQVTRQTVSRWEHGAVLPSMDSLRRLSQLYGVSLDYFIDEEMEEVVPTTETTVSVTQEQNSSDSDEKAPQNKDECMSDKSKELSTVNKNDRKKRTVALLIAAIIVLCVVCFFVWKELSHQDTFTKAEDESWLSDLQYDDVESSQRTVFQFE